MPTLLNHYQRLVAAGSVNQDASQIEVLEKLEQLRLRLSRGKKSPTLPFLKRKQQIKGVYLWGNVGRGKSMIMELFYAAAPVPSKRRVHFHDFMQELHAGLHRIRQQQQKARSGGDPLMVFARELMQNVRLLCFDELQATDVADASVLFRLFEQLFEAGVVIVATSNHPPPALYTGGVQRERFVPFISLLQTHMEVVALNSAVDYRHIQMKAQTVTYFTPLGSAALAFVEATIERLVPGIKPVVESLTVQGRSLPLTWYNHSLVRASFKDLCERPLGAADYLSIARAADTLILTDVPVLTPEKRNEARRFITLIDALYEQKTKLVITAAAAPERLYIEGDGSFEFQRTASRLAEMQSDNYMLLQTKEATS